MLEALKPVTLAGEPGNAPVIFLHGFMGCADDWQPVADALGDRHHVLAINLPGHGPGWDDVLVESIDMTTCVDGIVAQLDALALERPALVGYSLGGRVALCLGARHPDRVGRLVVESASPGLDTEEKRENRRVLDGALADRLATMTPQSEAYRDFLEEWYAMPLFETLHRRPEALEALITRRVEGNVPERLAQSLRALGTGNQPNLWPELHAFRPPTLVLAGEDDRKFRIIAEDMALACPAMAVEIMAGCGHNIHVENAHAFITATRAFLNPAGG